VTSATAASPPESDCSLDGAWAFWPDLGHRLPTGPGGAFVETDERDAALGPPRTARVPAPWQAQFEDLRLWAGTAWYERDLPLAAHVADRRWRLSFGAVDYFTTVWINGQAVGDHEGGYLPFSFDVTDLMATRRPNTLTVRVLDVGPDDDDGPFPFAEIPHGKQSWYGPIGGPWQSVRLESHGRVAVQRAHVDADPFTGDVTAAISLDGVPDLDDDVRWRIVAPGGEVVATGGMDARTRLVRTTVPNVLRWDIDAPHLYRFETDVVEAGIVTRHREDAFGFRAVGVSDGRVSINGRPVYLLGALDQDYWMPDITTPADDRAFDAQMRRARELGINLLRCHLKPPDPRYLAAADRAGVLVWCEPPNWIDLTEPAKVRVRDTIAGMIDRDYNHPSVVIRSIVNEDWGTDLPSRRDHREWLRETYRWTKSMDPSRLVVDNSACSPNFHVESDLNDFHVYGAVPEQARSWAAWTTEWVRNPAATYSPHGDAIVRGTEPLVLSEFGIWGLPNPEALLDADAREPWWFDTGTSHSEGVVHPAGVQERFYAWGLEGVFGSFESFVRASQEHEFEGLKRQIEELRVHDSIAGYVITEFTDVHWEANGLLDMRRRPKAFHERFDAVNAPNVAIVRTDRLRYRSGENAVAAVLLAGPEGGTDGPIEWQLDGFGVGGQARSTDVVRFSVPHVDRPTRARLSVLWTDPAGRTINHTSSAIWFCAAVEPVGDRNVDVATRWDDVAANVASGGKAVILVENEDALPAGASVQAQAFASDAESAGYSVYGNAWELSTGMGWLSPTLSRGLAIGPRVDLVFEGLTPGFVLAGYGSDARTDVLAGHSLGWLHRIRATVAAFSHGRGAGIFCTFPLGGRADPLGARMLDRLMAIAEAPEFSPRMKI
jgi:Glycosyl hydrolases family 2, sugar binding domain/Glycosyl hydrolases family 2, TIM barrel domain/Glycosyl hydrolases family 2